MRVNSGIRHSSTVTGVTAGESAGHGARIVVAPRGGPPIGERIIAG
jgi:hypothetical protein